MGSRSYLYPGSLIVWTHSGKVLLCVKEYVLVSIWLIFTNFFVIIPNLLKSIYISKVWLQYIKVHFVKKDLIKVYISNSLTYFRNITYIKVKTDSGKLLRKWIVNKQIKLPMYISSSSSKQKRTCKSDFLDVDWR